MWGAFSVPGTVPGSGGRAVDTTVRNPAWCSQSLHAEREGCGWGLGRQVGMLNGICASWKTKREEG